MTIVNIIYKIIILIIPLIIIGGFSCIFLKDYEIKQLDIISEQPQPPPVKKDTFIQPTYVDHRLNLSNFNFSGKCREPFKYRNHSKRDLIFTAIKYDNKKKWKKHKKSIQTSTNIMRNTLPNATKICAIYEDNNELKQFIESCGFEVMVIPTNGQQVNALIDRFLQLDMFLKNHPNDFDRVAIIDFRDVFFFADGFQTISDDEVLFTQECVHYPPDYMVCYTYPQRLNSKWMRAVYGEEVLKPFEEEKRIIHNVGVIIGGIKPFTQLLEVFVNEIHRMKDKILVYGIDNCMLNYLQYSGKFSHINVTVNKFTQRLAFTIGGGYDYDAEKKAIVNSVGGCSPIIRHKVQGNKDLVLN